MELKFGEDKSSLKRDLRLSRSARIISQKTMRSNLLEAIAQMQGGSIVSGDEDSGGGTVRMKIVVRKQDLKNLLEMMGKGSGNNIISHQANPSSLATLEQHLHVLRSRQLRRSAELTKGSRGSSWRPVLQSIPEEP